MIGHVSAVRPAAPDAIIFRAVIARVLAVGLAGWFDAVIRPGERLPRVRRTHPTGRPAGGRGLPSSTCRDRRRDQQRMLADLGCTDLAELLNEAIPAGIRDDTLETIPPAVSEAQVLAELRALADRNTVLRAYLGLGYHGTVTPAVIQRNVLENPAWYTAYTPYQPEISQGRLEVLLAFQTMVTDLTGMDVANASLLDEGTAAAEAMTLCHRTARTDRMTFAVDVDVHPQTLAVVQTRARGTGHDRRGGRLADRHAVRRHVRGPAAAARIIGSGGR
jgi:glycine cleavage system pyridoxal-binding protein P